MGAGYKFMAKAAEKKAEVLIYEDVGSGWFGGVTAKQVADDLRKAGQVDRIDVRLASYGGDVVAGLAIYRTLAEHPAKVVMHIDSMAASIASAIAMAGDQIIIAEAGSVMIHEAWTISAGNAKALRKAADNADAVTSQLVDIYVARTKQPRKKVVDWLAAETWFYGAEAVDNGFADSIAPNVQVAASASSLWSSVMHGRVHQHMHAARNQPPAGGDADPNADARASLAAVAERVRAARTRA